MKGCKIVIFFMICLNASAVYPYEIMRQKIPPKHCWINIVTYKTNTCTKDMTPDRADTLTDKGKFFEAASVYRCYLSTHPKEKSVYIDYADTQRILGNYCEALEILNTYQALFGQDDQYLKILARVYSDADYYDSALFINNWLLKKYPKSAYILATETNALFESGRPAAALYEYNRLVTLAPKSDELPDLYEEVIMPLQDNVSLGYRFVDLYIQDFPWYIPSGPQYINQNDGVEIYRLPLIVQKFLTPETSLLFKAQYERYHASPDSELLTINNEANIADWSFFGGFNTFINPHFQLQALFGSMDIQRYDNFFIYNVVGMFQTSETLTAAFQFTHDLFRPPEIYNGSPLMVSLNIIDTMARAHFTAQFDLETNMDIDLRAGRLTDNNSYFRVGLNPSTVIYNDDTTNASAILELNWFGFRRDHEFNGYYSPELYQSYSAGVTVDYIPNNRYTLQFYGVVGAVNDTFTPGFGLATAFALAGKYSLFKNFDIVGEVDYIYEQINPFYREVDASVGVNWRWD